MLKIYLDAVKIPDFYNRKLFKGISDEFLIFEL
ncbi:hypothetical protein SAMN05444483_104266 [Salegentibacter echinorum]|uniref:Uncharacterized protein n=1 Tax=Salegentibacter echinorum TaxID=1073325 RepID=A0A1M5GR03_SALEC|nr:hypothetical protein SAMN05444483_104266 [Salegentibacter echinorum]